MAEEDDLEEVVVTGRDVYSGAAGFQPFDLGGMAAAMNAWMESAAAAAAAAYQPTELQEVVIAAPRPAAPTPPPPPLTGSDVLRDLLERPKTATPAPPPPTELERLLQKPPPSEFERLLQKPMKTITVEAPRVATRIPYGPALRAASRALGPVSLLSLLPTMFHTGVKLDELATDSWLRRLNPESDREPSTEPKRAPRRPAAPAGMPTGFDDPLEEITVTGRAPSAPRPSSPAFTYVQPPMGTPLGPDALFAEPLTSPLPFPTVGPLPNAQPLPLDFAQPFADPLAMPQPAVAPRPSLQPDPVVATPPGVRTPSRPRGPLAPPLTWPSGLGEPSQPCDCKKTKEKPKKKKPRTVCWKGSYVEGSKSLKKTRRVRVDCATGSELSNSQI